MPHISIRHIVSLYRETAAYELVDVCPYRSPPHMRRTRRVYRRILLHMHTGVCCTGAHTDVYCCICILVYAVQARIQTYTAAYAYWCTCVRILRYMCRHTAVCVSACCCVCVRIHPAIECVLVLTSLCTCVRCACGQRRA